MTSIWRLEGNGPMKATKLNVNELPLSFENGSPLSLY